MKRVEALGEKGFCEISWTRALYTAVIRNSQTQWVKKGTSSRSEFTPLYISAHLMREGWVYSVYFFYSLQILFTLELYKRD